MKPSARTVDQVRAAPALLDTLDIVRQRMVVHSQAVRDPQFCRLVLDAIRGGSTAADLLKLVKAQRPATAADELQAVLFWLRQMREVNVILNGGQYDAYTLIHRL